MRANPGLSRRSFLSGRHSADPVPMRPPWTSEESLAAACTGCGDCIAACPQAILSTGADRLPILSFADRECTLCGRCADACEEAVFSGRDTLAFTHLATIEDTCFARRGIHCQTCGDACPESAIRFRARLGGPPTPVCPAEAVAVRPPEAAHG